MNRLAHILLLLFAVHSIVSAQKIVPSPEDLYSDAVEFMHSGDYPDALPMLLSLKDKGYNTANINYRIGECYLNIQGLKTKSIPFLRDASENISVHYTGDDLKEEYAPNKALLYLGIAYRLNYDFEKALASFNDFLRSFSDPDQESTMMAEYHKERCIFAQEMMAAPSGFTADTLPGLINTTISNFNPIALNDERSLFYMNRLKFYDAVMTSIWSDNGWNDPENMTPLIKSDGDHYLTGLSADGKLMLFTGYDPYLSGEIYFTEKGNDGWAPLQKIAGAVNTVFNESHASLSPDGGTLYFTSDRKGGFGGLDIYRSVKDTSGAWSQPENLGPIINSPYNEESPFVTPDGRKLFFSSQGHYNMGGYDVFVSTRGEDEKWMPPVNIGYPLNTTDDDLFFFPLDTGNIAYQARFSWENAQTDIVRYSIVSIGRPARFTVNGKIGLKADPGFNPRNISVTFTDAGRPDSVSTYLNDDGTFSQKLTGGRYNIEFRNRNDLLLSKDLVIPDYFPYNTLVINDDITIAPVKISDTVYIQDIRFAFDDYRPDVSSISWLDTLAEVLIKYPGVTVKISGYTDASGSEKYNLGLSKKRADAVKDYLSKKIEPGRIESVGFGEANPVAPNSIREGRHYNRRVEVTLLSLPDILIIKRVMDIPADIKAK